MRVKVGINSESQHFLDQIEFKFASCAGRPGTLEFTQIQDARVALTLMVDPDFHEDVVFEAVAELTSAVSHREIAARKEGSEAPTWNDYLSIINTLPVDFQQLAEVKLHRWIGFSNHSRLQRYFHVLLLQTFLAICTETTESSAFFSASKTILLDGHLICNWEGVYPEGDPVVF